MISAIPFTFVITLLTFIIVSSSNIPRELVSQYFLPFKRNSNSKVIMIIIIGLSCFYVSVMDVILSDMEERISKMLYLNLTGIIMIIGIVTFLGVWKYIKYTIKREIDNNIKYKKNKRKKLRVERVMLSIMLLLFLGLGFYIHVLLNVAKKIMDNATIYNVTVESIITDIIMNKLSIVIFCVVLLLIIFFWISFVWGTYQEINNLCTLELVGLDINSQNDKNKEECEHRLVGYVIGDCVDKNEYYIFKSNRGKFDNYLVRKDSVGNIRKMR